MAAQPPPPTGIRGLLSLLIEQVSELARLYAAAAVKEIQDSLNDLKVGSIFLAVTFMFLAVAAMVLVLFAVTALSRITGLELWAAALLILVIVVILIAIFAWLAYRRLRRVRVVPEQTIAAAKEDLEWVQNLTKRG